MSLNIIEQRPEEIREIEDIIHDTYISEDKFENEFQKTITFLRKEFEKSLEKIIEKHLLVTKYSKSVQMNNHD